MTRPAHKKARKPQRSKKIRATHVKQVRTRPTLTVKPVVKP